MGRTNNCTFRVEYRNGTVAYEAWSNNTVHQFNWLAAVNTTDYIVNFIIDHGTFGLLEFSHALYGAHGHPVHPSFNVFGNWGGVVAANIFPAIIIFTAGCIFSSFTVPEAGIVLVAIAAILEYLGWMNIGWTPISYAGAFSILVAIVFRRGKT